MIKIAALVLLALLGGAFEDEPYLLTVSVNGFS